MKKNLLLLLAIIVFTSTYAQFNWIQKANFSGGARQGAVSFGINGKGYLGEGINGFGELGDFWQYDPATNAWTQVASMPGSLRRRGAAFTIGDKGYVTLGYSDANDLSTDLWEYDPGNNTWTKKADFPGPGRWFVTGFSIGNKGYIGGGSDGAGGSFSDFWEYDPATNTWTKKADFPAGTRFGCMGFGIGSKGYMGGGAGGNPFNVYKDLWEYDPATDTWTQKADYGGAASSSAASFTIGNKGYDCAEYTHDFWEYDPIADHWTRQPDFAGSTPDFTTGFSDGTRGYIGTGIANGTYSSEFWAFEPCTPAGDPSVFGDNVWNVYGWNGGGGNINSNAWNLNYAGYYVEPSLSFNTTDRWSNTASPSGASGYQGCVINPDNHSWSAKRKGFPCGVYSINIPAHDDASQLFVNGVKVWEHDGCCDAHTKVWIGALGSESTIEFRTTEGGGNSNGQIQIVPATPTITAAGLTDICPGNSVILMSDISEGNQWYKDGEAIQGANAQSYAATETGDYTTSVDVPGCTASSSLPITVTVASQAAPGDPSAFGDNTWNVSAYNSGNGTLTGTDWQSNYSGYYTDNTVSFDTRNKWSTSGTPSDADTYQGCPVSKENNSWSAKRKGFACGDYAISIVGHDNAAQLFIDGIKVWEHDGCCDSHDAVWTGALDGNSTIEFRGTNSNGTSYGAIDISIVIPAIMANGITTFCPGYSITLTASESQNGYLWSTGETTQTITVSQSGSYTVKEQNSCNVLVESLPVVVTVQPLAKPVLISSSGPDICNPYNGGFGDFNVTNIDYSLIYTLNSDSAIINYFSGYGYFLTAFPGTYFVTSTDALGCSAVSDPMTFTEAPGNPDEFGDNTWNVYAFNNGSQWGVDDPWKHYVQDIYYGLGSINAYQGYYTEPNLSFDTKDRWNENGTPADVPGFNGCSLIYTDNFSWSAKRKGFPCGNYSISIPAHDDDAELYIDSVLVWQETGAVSNNNDSVWQGMLGPNSTIEFRVRDYGGGCSGAISVVYIGAAPTRKYYHDADGDGFGDPSVFVKSCSAPTGYVANKRDCNDADATVHPGALDICDGIDNDCDGAIDEDCRSVTITDASVTEGNKGQKTMSFIVELNKKSPQVITVNYTTQDNTTTAGNDYVAQSGTLTFTPGLKKLHINVIINGDKVVEPNETFSIILSDPVNAVINDDEATGTIINDDGGAIAAAQTNKMDGKAFIKVSPNPANNNINVQLFGYSGNVTILLQNREGKILINQKMQPAILKLAQQQINVSNFAAGAYFLTVIDEKGNRQTEKVIIAR